jgi:hypothetical protein
MTQARAASLLLAMCIATLSACAPRCAPGAPMVAYDLIFGRTVVGRTPVSDAEWASFVDRVVTPNLPDGFTVLDGDGQWRASATAEIVRDPTKILIVALPPSDRAAHAIEIIRKTYETEFHQQSVGMIAHDSCADFSS